MLVSWRHAQRVDPVGPSRSWVIVPPSRCLSWVNQSTVVKPLTRRVCT